MAVGEVRELWQAAAEQMRTAPQRYSQLSPARQALVRLCQDVNFGQILDLLVRNAEPIWDPGPTILSEVRLDIEEVPRPEGKLPDFRLSSELLRLMRRLDGIRDGRIAKIEIREGIPRRLVVAAGVRCLQSAGPGKLQPRKQEEFDAFY
jgi:hypothetical protein